MKVEQIIQYFLDHRDQIFQIALVNLPQLLEPLIQTGEFSTDSKRRIDCFTDSTIIHQITYHIKYDLMLYNSTDDLKIYANLLKPLTGLGLIFNFTNPNPNWDSLCTDQWIKLYNPKTNTGMIQRKKIKIAILLVGLTRKFREASTTFFKNFIDQNRTTCEFDFFLYTWDRPGDYQYENKNFQDPLESNWVIDTDQPLSESDRNDLIKIYQPRLFKYESYQTWQQSIQSDFDQFLIRCNITDEPLRIYNGIFAQYYQVHRGFQLIDQFLNSNSNPNPTLEYDLVIRTRYDLTIPQPSNNLNWTHIYQISQEKLISLEQWDRNGIRGNFIVGNYTNMKKYADLYNFLGQVDSAKIHRIKLASIHIPKYIFNYLFADQSLDPEKLDPVTIYQKAYPYSLKSTA